MKKLLLLLVVISLTGFGQTADDYYNKGISKFNIKDYKGAISEFNKTIILNPNYADAYINRGISKKKTLDYTGAIADYNKAIQLNPNNSDYFYNRGIAKYNLEDYNGSISDFNKAIELDSDNSDAYTMKEDATKKLKGNSGAFNNKENKQPSTTTPITDKQTNLIKKKINFGLYWISNFPQAPYGFGYNLARIDKKIGFYNNLTFGGSNSGNSVSTENNSGIYKVGTWGNKLTGKTNNYITNEIICLTIGATYKYLTSDFITANIYCGLGLANYSSSTYISVQAEDVTSGINVNGYYWLDDKDIKTNYNATNFSIGTFLSVKHILIGIGYETSPAGIQLSIGFNF